MMYAVITKFNIGDTFWVPRVYPKNCMDIKIINGKEYVHEYTELTIKVKPKKIHSIEIKFNKINDENFGEIVADKIVYVVLDNDLFRTYYTESKTPMFATEQEAYDYAENHKNLMGTELYH